MLLENIRGLRGIVYKAILYIILFSGAVIFVAPAYYVIIQSFTQTGDAYSYPPGWWPKEPTKDNWTVVLNYTENTQEIHMPINEKEWDEFWSQRQGRKRLLPLWIFNTLKIISAVMLGGFFSVTLAGYAFAKIDFWGKEKAFGLLLSSMFLPYMLYLLPRYILFKEVGLANTHLALILPKACGPIFLIFMARQFFIKIPNELIDSARIDGASHLRIYWDLIIPMSKPIIATIMVLIFISSWNSFMEPLIFLNSAVKYTLTIGIAAMGGSYAQVPLTIKAAASVVLFVPVLIIYSIGQRYFIEGLTSGAVKQ